MWIDRSLEPVSLALWRGTQGYLPDQGHVKLKACLGSGLQLEINYPLDCCRALLTTA